MKSIFTAVLVSAFATSAFAGQITDKLPKDAISLSAITKAEVLDSTTPEPHCPAGAICEPAAQANILLHLSGCANRLGPVTYSADRAQDGKTDIYLSAYEVNTKTSLTAMCIAAPTAQVKIFLGLGFISKEEIRLHILENFNTPAPLSNDVLGLTPVSDITLSSVNFTENSCPKEAHCLIMVARAVANLTLKYGCANEVSAVNSYVVENADGKIDLYVAATEINKKESLTARCFAQPTKSVAVSIGARSVSKDDVRLHVLTYKAQQ